MLLGKAKRATGGEAVEFGGRRRVTGHLEQVGADDSDAMVAGEGGLGLGGGELLERCPRAMHYASATIRLSVTMGPGATVSSRPYKARIWGQSVSSARIG